MSRRLLPFLAALATSCGGGGSSVPTRPLTPAPTPTPLRTPTLVDGITGQPVEGALLTPQSPGRNERMMVTAPSYLTREQLYTGEPVRLWPAKDEDYVRQLVYTNAVTRAEIRMRRFAGASFTLGLPPDIGDFPRARDTFAYAADEASRVSGLAISLAEAGPVRVVIDPDAFLNRPNTCALTRIWLSGDLITQAEIVYPNVETARGLANRCDRFGIAAHELGHALGLQHVEDRASLMNPVLFTTSYSAREEETLQMMYRHRRAGNGAPDREVGLQPGSTGVRMEVIVD